MISCREVSTVVSTDALGNQSWRRRLAVRLHLMMCDGCRRFAAEIEAIRRGTAAAARSFDAEAEGLESRVGKAMEPPESRRRAPASPPPREPESFE
jgi:anti-sigma factor ChrR (cupin superfamily)